MIGERLRFNVGKLDYNELDPALTKPVIIAVGVGVALLIIIVIIVLIAYRRKSTESTRVLKNMQVIGYTTILTFFVKIKSPLTH
jgi:plexin A